MSGHNCLTISSSRHSKPNNKPFFQVYLVIVLMTPFQLKASLFCPMSKMPQGWDNMKWKSDCSLEIRWEEKYLKKRKCKKSHCSSLLSTTSRDLCCWKCSVFLLEFQNFSRLCGVPGKAPMRNIKNYIQQTDIIHVCSEKSCQYLVERRKATWEGRWNTKEHLCKMPHNCEITRQRMLGLSSFLISCLVNKTIPALLWQSLFDILDICFRTSWYLQSIDHMECIPSYHRRLLSNFHNCRLSHFICTYM